MGRRRKKAKKIVEKKRVHLSKQFKCPHCNYDDAVNCKIDRKEKIAYLKCRICQQSFELSPINYLHQPIDIFCAWIDELEEANKRGSDDDDEDDEDLFSDDENDKWEKQNARE